MSESLYLQYVEAIRNMDLRSESISNEVSIHPTALIEQGAQLGKGVHVGPFSRIGGDVVLEDDVWIDSHVVISGNTRVGTQSRVWPFATLGVIPQDLKFHGEKGELHIGKRNMIREYCNFSIGTEGGGKQTTIGDENLFMVHVHVGHDDVVGSHCIFANGVSLAGHVKIEDHALLMGHAAVHQFCTVGKFALCAGGAMVTQDVAPYLMVHGNRAKENGLNLIGLKRAGYSNQQLDDVKTMHRLVFRENLTIDDAIVQIENLVQSSLMREDFITFIRASERGLCR